MFVCMFALVVYIALKTPSTGDNLTTALLRIASTWAQLASLLLTARLPPRSILDDVINVLGDVAGGVPLQSNPIQCTFGSALGFYRRFYLFLSLPFLCLSLGLFLGGLYFLFRLCARSLRGAASPKQPTAGPSNSLDAPMQSGRSQASDFDIDDARPGNNANALLSSSGAGHSENRHSPSGVGPVGEPASSNLHDAAEVSEPLDGAIVLSPKGILPKSKPSPPLQAAGLNSSAVSQGLATPGGASLSTMNDAPVDEGAPSMWSAVRQKGARATLVLLFLAHFSVTKATLLVLDTFDKPLFGFIRFRSDLRHGDFDGEYDQARSLAYAGLLIFGIGLPLAAVLLLAYYKFDLNRSHTRDTFGFLYMGYRLGPGSRLGGARAAVILREVQANPAWSRYRPKTCGWLCTWVLGEDSDDFYDEEDEIMSGSVPQHAAGSGGLSESKGAHGGGGDSDGEDEGDPTPAGGKVSVTGAIITEEEASALTHTGYWSWEFIIVARKILMTTVSVTVRAPFTQSAVMVMILTMSLCLHVGQSPYASKLLNAAETMALVVLWISAMAGVVLYEEGELSDATAESVRGIIVFSNVLLMSFFAFILLYALSSVVRLWAARQYRSCVSALLRATGKGGMSSPFKSGWGSSLFMSTADKGSSKRMGAPAVSHQDEDDSDVAFTPDQLKGAPVRLSSPPSTTGAAASYSVGKGWAGHDGAVSGSKAESKAITPVAQAQGANSTTVAAAAALCASDGLIEEEECPLGIGEDIVVPVKG
jgi:hypothetical protein